MACVCVRVEDADCLLSPFLNHPFITNKHFNPVIMLTIIYVSFLLYNPKEHPNTANEPQYTAAV